MASSRNSGLHRWYGFNNAILCIIVRFMFVGIVFGHIFCTQNNHLI